MKKLTHVCFLIVLFIIVGCEAHLTEPTVEPEPVLSSASSSSIPVGSKIPWLEVKLNCDPGTGAITETDGSTIKQGYPLDQQDKDNGFFWDPTVNHDVVDQNIYYQGECSISSNCTITTSSPPYTIGDSYVANPSIGPLYAKDKCDGNLLTEYEVNMFSVNDGNGSVRRPVCSAGEPYFCPGGCFQGACICAPGNSDYPACLDLLVSDVTLKAYSASNNYDSRGSFSGVCDSGSANINTTANDTDSMKCNGGDLVLTCDVSNAPGYHIEFITNSVYTQPTNYQNCNNQSTCTMNVNNVNSSGKTQNYFCMISK